MDFCLSMQNLIFFYQIPLFSSFDFLFPYTKSSFVNKSDRYTYLDYYACQTMIGRREL